MDRKIQILHLEDNQIDRKLVRALLAEGGLACDFGYAEARAEFVDLLSGKPWDLILADQSLPDFDGCSALDIAKELVPQTPFIFLTGTMGEEFAVETLKRGATDYVIKERIERLVPVVARALAETEEKRRFQQVAEKLKSTEQRFHLFIDSIREYAIYLVDAAGTIISWNSGAKRIFGHSEDEALGTSMRSLFCQESGQDNAFERLLQTAQSRGHAEEELWLVRNHGAPFCTTVSVTPVYDVEPGLQGFAVITQDITERKQARNQLLISAEELRASLREKEILLQEVHHRVKNNLQVISSLISLQLRPIKDPVSREALQTCQARVQSISLIHAMLYQSRDYANVPFSLYARELADNIFNAVGTDPGRISLDLAIDEVMLPVDKAIPCGLILNELITNALKHGFPNDRRGIVRVELRRAGQDQLRLSVEDNGVGMAPGLETGQSGSLGMHLISALAEQLGAEFEMSGDHGTSFRFTFASGTADLPGPGAIAAGRKFVADSLPSASRAEAPLLQTS
ncbi:MAG TPA: histidine kinase dimerization/phosphoacceptor domain -containing protein [Verrucomicrobiae bacterium]|nr:histidine kinase dimerization/phosphoacceptor domain -containing protein [Verrucomicrobiae bacterium]